MHLTHRAAAGMRSRRALAASLAVLALGATAACDTANAIDRPQPPNKGGTLHVILGTKLENLDPQKIQTATDANISRLFTRTLTTFKSEPGDAAGEIVGDLATDTGRPSEGNKVWDFTLKKDVKWQDGNPVTCTQVKYGVERNYSSLFDGSLTHYPRDMLVDNQPPYDGPFKGDNNNNKGLLSVECIDEGTIRFHLKNPVGDFGYTVALPTFAPVPKDKDQDKALYDRQPFSNGPYKIVESNDARLVLERNPFWIQRTDLVRKAYPDRIVASVDPAGPKVSYAIIQDQGDYASSVQLDLDVASNFVQQVVNDDELSKRLVQGGFSGVRFLAINTRLVKDVRCRQALIFAANKRKFRSAMGGQMFGDLATSAITPSLRSHKEFDLYNAKTKPEGDRERARALLQEAGAACPKKIHIAFPESRRRLMATIAESFQLVGVETELVGIDPGKVDYFGDAIGRPDNSYEVMWAGWIADWANGSAVIPLLFDGDTIPRRADANRNTNFSLLDDPAINAAIDEASREADINAQYRMWGEVDQKIMEQGAMVPLLYMRALRMVGSNVRGAFIHPQYGQPDVCALGLAKP